MTELSFTAAPRPRLIAQQYGAGVRAALPGLVIVATESCGVVSCPKYVFEFTEGGKDEKDLLGGKGANLAEMTRLGLPVRRGSR